MAKISRGVGVYTPFLDVMPTPVYLTRAPASTDTNYSVGQIWVYKNGNDRTVYIYCGTDSSSDGLWESVSSGSGFDITFASAPLTCSAANTGAAASGATGATNLLGLQSGVIMEQFILGAGQTIIKPVMDSTGLLVSLDLVDTEGVEYNFGAARNNNPYAFTIGTSPAFYFEVALNVADVSGGNPYMIGFRKTEANNATLGSYTDYALIGMNNGVSATNVSLLTELNAGGQTTTDTTNAWADGETKTLKVLVSSSGAVTYTIDGEAPTATAAFTFDSGDVVTPFIRITHNAEAGAVRIVSMACDYQ